MTSNDFLSFKQITAEYPFSAGTLRRLLFHRTTNGLSSAVLQNKRKLIFKRATFEKWIENYFTRHGDNELHTQIDTTPLIGEEEQ